MPMSKINCVVFVNGENYSLAFFERRIPDGTKYFITAQNGKGNVIHFEMKEEGGKWKIIQPAPTYIIDIEDKLSEIILNKNK